MFLELVLEHSFFHSLSNFCVLSYKDDEDMVPTLRVAGIMEKHRDGEQG